MPRSDYGRTINNLLLLRGDIEGRGASAIGQARAREAESLGNIWGRAITQFGQIPGQVVDQIREGRRNDLQEQSLRGQIADRNALAADRQQKISDANAEDRAFSPAAALGPGGVGPMSENAPAPTRDQILAAIPGHLRGKVQETFAEADKLAEQSRESRKKAEQDSIDYLGFLGVQIRDAKYDPAIASLALQHAAEAHADDPESLRQIAQMRQAFASDPTAIQRVTDSAIRVSKYKDVLKPAGEYTLKPGESRFNDQNQPIASVPEKPPNATEEQDKARYRDIQTRLSQKQSVTAMEQAWAAAYEKEKTLTTDRSASAAADRQANAIREQTAQQKRAQDFTQLQAARADIQKNVDTPYLTARTSADTLRDVVAAAKNGNEVAGSLQSLEATMAAIRAQGLNRINTAEIGATGNAGSLWDNISGYVGKKLAGQPVPEDLQRDMLAFADILDTAAYKKYTDAHDSANKLYGTTIPRSFMSQPRSSDAAALPKDGDTKPIPGHPGTEQTFKNGKWIRTK